MLTITLFSAQWCAPCKGMKPHWNRYTTEHKKEATFKIIDADTAPGTVKAALVQSFPTIVITEGTKELGRITNAPKTYMQFKKSLDPYLPTA